MTNIYDLDLAPEFKVGAIGKVFGAHYRQAKQRYDFAYQAPAEEQTGGFKIEAISQFNDGHAFTLDRYPSFRFEKKVIENTLCLVANDGPFFKAYKYEEPKGRFQAFAGANFDIPMLDGSVTKASGQWWHIHYPSKEVVHATVNSEQSLKGCFVFYGAEADREALSLMVNQYFAEGGLIYDGCEYRKLLSRDQEFKDRWRETGYQRSAKRAVIRNARNLNIKKNVLEQFILAQGYQLSDVYGANNESLSVATELKNLSLKQRPIRFIVGWKA